MAAKCGNTECGRHDPCLINGCQHWNTMLYQECGFIEATESPAPSGQTEFAGYGLPASRLVADRPATGKKVLAIVRHWHTKGKRYAVIYSVKESDTSWRTVDDNSELSHDWNVIAWDYLPEL